MGIFSIVRLRSIRNADYAVEDLELILQTDIFISIDLSDGCWQASLPAGQLDWRTRQGPGADSSGQMRIRPRRCGFARADADPPDELPMSRRRFFKVTRSHLSSLKHGLTKDISCSNQN